VEKDKRHIIELNKLGWSVLVIWECEAEKQIDDARQKILNFLKM
jgi:G:T-mismatch repair DNA endonuclease (very short patch repair protein)